jgi:nucleotidyltransferase substrate binding protein (TIGR01987 family)
MADSDVRWIQRFDNYKKALGRLNAAVELSNSRELTELEQQGLIKRFEYTFELAWNVMKDYLTEMGIGGIIGSKGAIRHAFKNELIREGQIWMDMIDSRNLLSHTYDEDKAAKLVNIIRGKYIGVLPEFYAVWAVCLYLRNSKKIII